MSCGGTMGRLTIYAEPDYNTTAWRKVSKEALDFVKSKDER